MTWNSDNTVIVGMSDVVREWEQALEERRKARARRDRALRVADRRLLRARGGLSEKSWQRAISERAQPRTPVDGRSINQALRGKLEAIEARAELERIDRVTVAAVRAADRELARATNRLLIYGSAAAELTGVPVRRLVRMSVH